MLEDGMKVIAVARKPMAGKSQILRSDEDDMILMGYLAFLMPRRKRQDVGSGPAETEGSSQGLDGDQAKVAVSICRRVGIVPEKMLTGTDT